MTATATGEPRPSTTGRAGDRWLWRVRQLVVCLVYAGFALNSDPGKVVNDTKLDLVVDPVAFMQRALHLWDPLGSSGQLQNQAYGYLFPMGPFFAAGHGLGVPGWAVQRLWWALVLIVAHTGFVALTRRLGVGTEWSRLVGGVGFALAPHVVTVLGKASIEAWPPALAPWVLVPLVGLGAKGSPRRAAALSGLAVLCMGGVNAAVDLAAVLPAALWLLTRRWDRAWLRLVTWWVPCVLGGIAWWVGPLLVLGRYSPPFLDYIESADFTTRTATLVETIRGTSDWVAYIPTGSQAGLSLLTDRVLIAGTVIAVVGGLLGLTLRRTPERRWLLTLLLAGVLLGTLGYGGSVHGPLAEAFRTLLDGPLAPIRNIHKFDILIRLALSIGLTCALAHLARGRTRAETRFLTPVVAAAGAFVVVAASTPYWGLAASPTRAFDGIPDYWRAANAWLSARDATGRTLLLPGSRFAEYVWGYAGDEPIQALGTVPWDVRNAVPLTDPSHVRWLDAVERSVADGRGSRQLHDALAGAGVRYVLLRNDIAFGPQGATRPFVARATLRTTPGVKRVATFGPVIGGSTAGSEIVDDALGLAAPSIELYEVSATGDARIGLHNAAEVPRVVGGAEAAVPLADGFAPFARSVVGDRASAREVTGPLILTDSPRRREVNVGVGAFGASYTLTSTEQLRIPKPVRDYGSTERPGAEAVATTPGGVSIAASSSAGDADTFPGSDVGSQPYAAFDGSLRSAWRPNTAAGVRNAWVEIRFAAPVDLTGATVVLDRGSRVRTLGVRTDRGDTTVAVTGDRASLPGVSSRLLRISLVKVDALGEFRAAVRGVSIPGVTVRRTVVLPDPGPSEIPDIVSVTGDLGSSGCLVAGDRPLCSPRLVRVGEEAGGLDRTFVSRAPYDVDASATARPVPSAAWEEKVMTALDLPVRAEVSSRAVPDLGGGAVAAVDGDLTTGWVADNTDTDPSISLSWQGKKDIRDVQLLLDEYVAATRPAGLRITSPDGERSALLDPSGTARFEPLHTDRMTLHLTAGQQRTSIDPYTLARSSLGIGVSDLRIPGLLDTVSFTPRPRTERVPVPCGDGPDLVIAGTTVHTKARPSVSDLLTGRVVRLTPCDPGQASDTASAGGTATSTNPATVHLPTGLVDLRAGGDDRWDVAQIMLVRRGLLPDDRWATTGTPQVLTWAATSRSVQVPARRAPVVLRVAENANPGWRATLDGGPLTAVPLDGWQQGYLMPAGPAGTVRIEFAPDRPVRVVMASCVLFALALALFALAAEPRRRSLEVRPGGRATRLGVLAGGAGVLVLVGGAWGVAALLVAGVLRRWRGGRLAPVLAPTAYGLAGSVLLTGPYTTSDYRAGDVVVQSLCLLVLAAAVAGLWRGALRPRWARSMIGRSSSR